MSLTLTLNTVGKVVHEEIEARIAEIDAAGGGTLRIVNEQLLADGIVAAMLNPLTIDFVNAGKLTLGAGLSVPAIKLHGAGFALHNGFAMVSPRIDVSAGVYRPGVASSEAIELGWFPVVRIDNPELYGGSEPLSGGGDSGVAGSAIHDLKISGGKIEGFNDLGVYASGPNPPGGSVWTIDGTIISRCRGGVTCKRGLDSYIVRNAVFNENIVGIRSDWISGGPVNDPGVRIEVQDTKITRSMKAGVVIQGPTLAKFRSVVIEDIGHDQNDKSKEPDAAGIVMDGASGADFKDVRIAQRRWPAKSRVGIRTGNMTVDGTKYRAGNNAFTNMEWVNLAACVAEEGRVNGSTYSGTAKNCGSLGFTGKASKTKIRR